MLSIRESDKDNMGKSVGSKENFTLEQDVTEDRINVHKSREMVKVVMFW